MPSHETKLVPWNQKAAHDLGRKPVVAQHGLHKLDLFSDHALGDLLETYPRDQMQVFTMGTDPLKWAEWKPVDTAGSSGKDILRAIIRGRLWLHLFQIQKFDSRYRGILEQLFSEVREMRPDMDPSPFTGTLLISSPRALVYYHADAQPNLLWHIRGLKRVWVYPAEDREIIDQERMEDIFASHADEEVPYKQEFDRKASVYDLTPGEVVAWPLNSPHRVTNLEGLNVSLSTVYETPDSYRRKLVYCANRLFRRSYGIPTRSINEFGLASYIKRTAYRGCRRLGVVQTPERRMYVTDLRIDPLAQDGVSRMADGPRLTEFSQAKSLPKVQTTVATH
jgi:hypothetical protein